MKKTIFLVLIMAVFFCATALAASVDVPDIPKDKPVDTPMVKSEGTVEAPMEVPKPAMEVPAITMDAPTEPVEMVFPGEKARWAPFMFEHHKQHLAVEGGCTVCHHKWDGKGKIIKCADKENKCHFDTSKENKNNPESYDSAFHAKKSDHSCLGCHKIGGKGPTSPCTKCHTKAPKS